MSEEKDYDPRELGDRMKKYEKEVNDLLTLPKDKPFIIRLDGHGFSKFTKGFKKPWDIRIHNAMIEVSSELLKTFNPHLVYTFSDEITMCFPQLDAASFETGVIPDLPFGGKFQKLLTLTAGLSSTVFYKAMMKQDYERPKEDRLVEKLEASTPHFDARAFILPSNEEMINNLVWRSLFDCKRNSVSGLAQANFPHNAINGLSQVELKKKLLAEKNINYDNEPDWYKYGCYLKKQNYILDTVSPVNNQPVQSTRTKIRNDSFSVKDLPKPIEYLKYKILPIDYNLFAK